MEEKYKFTSKLTGKTVEIDILPDDIIVGGELRRIIRDENGQIPEWAKPIHEYQDCIRVSPNGKAYGKIKREIKTRQPSGRYTITGKDSINKFGSLSLLKALTYSFNPQFKGKPFNDREMDAGVDITTINKEDTKITNSTIYGYNSGKYGLPASINGAHLKEYKMFQHMHERCSDKVADYRPTYNDCKVSSEFYDYQDFAKWYIDSIYKVGSEAKTFGKINLDKDIINHKLYSPQTCLLIPQYINAYFVGADRKGIGAQESSDGKWLAYSALFLSNKQKKYLGAYDSTEEAHQAWANFKNEQLRKVVIPYFINDVLPEYRNHPMVLKVIDALTNYKFN